MQAATKTPSKTFINMIFAIGNLNGQIKIYHNESNYLSHGTADRTVGSTGGGTGGGTVFDDDEDESPRHRNK
jgi:hypothetical protein